jgi:hypothetical protein
MEAMQSAALQLQSCAMQKRRRGQSEISGFDEARFSG